MVGLAKLCDGLFKIFAAILSLFIFGIIVNVFSGMITNYVPKDWITNLKKPTEWMFQNLPLVILTLIIFLLLMTIFYLVSHRPPSAPIQNAPASPSQTSLILPTHSQPTTNKPSTEKDLSHRYLQRMVCETELLRLTGVPAGLVAPSVPLDDVFIPLEFFPRRLPSDYPISKEEYGRYRDLLQRGQFSEEMERAFVSTEKSWLALLREGEKATIADLWQQLNRKTPVAVVQGYPGMGKSTLMARLTLHMARCGLGQPDPAMTQPLENARSAPIPILLLLKEYAIELEKALATSNSLSLIEYMQLAIERLHMPGLFPFLQTCLAKGRCLIMLDGLDEVSEIETRKRVKQAIETSVLEYRVSPATT